MSRALAMISGGLDSILAAKLIKDQGIEVIGICFKSYFFNEENAKRMCAQIDIQLEVVDFSNEHFEMLKNPKHGYGKNMNPCIDCHAMMMRYSGELLKKFNADFIITGEVLNQRPMSQNKSSLNLVKKESGFGEKILRPLCAKNLPETEMELNGLVDRNALLDISGRSRTRQMELAEKWGIKDYPSPAGGCKLTEPNYSKKLKDLMSNKENIKEEELELLHYGRHFRINRGLKIIISRTFDESNRIKEILKDEIVMLPVSHKGAMCVVQGEFNEEELKLIAGITARYAKADKEEDVKISYGKYKTKFENSILIKPLSDNEIKQYSITE